MILGRGEQALFNCRTGRYQYNYERRLARYTSASSEETVYGFSDVMKRTYYAYAADNSLTKSYPDDEERATYYHYDDSGSCIRIDSNFGTTYFEYTAANLPEKVIIDGGSTYEFAYDGNLQRRAVVEDGTATYYVWDGLNLLETRNADYSLKARYTHGYSNINGIGSCIEIYRASDGKRYYLLSDHRGSVYSVLDENKAEVGRRLYNAFGELVQETLASGYSEWPEVAPFGYQSNWMTLCTLPDGLPLYLSPTRLYEAGTGRFLQRDLIQELEMVRDALPRTVSGIRIVRPSHAARVATAHTVSNSYADYQPMDEVDPLGLRTVRITIRIDRSVVDEARRRHVPFNRREIQSRIQALLDQCFDPCKTGGRTDYATKDKIQVAVIVGDYYKKGEPTGDPGLMYTDYSLLANWRWYGFFPTELVFKGTYAAARDVYVLSTRQVTGWQGTVVPSSTGGGVVAYTGTGSPRTTMNVGEFRQQMHGFDEGEPSWPDAWANVIAHEQIWRGIMGKYDRPFAPRGDIRSGTAGGNAPAAVPDSFCRELADTLGVE